MPNIRTFGRIDAIYNENEAVWTERRSSRNPYRTNGSTMIIKLDLDPHFHMDHVAVRINESVCRTFRRTVLPGHSDLSGSGAVAGLNVRGEEWREANKRRQEGSSSPSMSFGSSPPLC